MSSLILAAIFALGAIVASFIGVVVARLNTGTSFLVGHSQCDACAAILSPSALIPIVSYFAMRGRARCCGARVSLVGPSTELLLGGFFALAFVKLGFVVALPFMFVSLALLGALVLYDLLHQILPSSLLAVFVFSSVATGFFLSPSLGAFVSSTGMALLIAASLLFIHFISRGRAMGFADAPFVFGLSVLVGPAAFPGFIFSFWIGAALGIIVLLRRPVGSRMGVEVPFAPFLAAGFLLAYFTQWNPFVFITFLSVL